MQPKTVISVGSRAALVTSENLSRAAAERGIEAGLLVEDPLTASGIKQCFMKIREAGEVVVL